MRLQFFRVLDYIYPPRCPVCEDICGDGICTKCRAELIPVGEDYCLKCGKPLPDAMEEYCRDCTRRGHIFYQGRSLYSYQGKVQESLYRLKYKNRREYASVYGKEMARQMSRWIRACRIDVVIPIPLHPSRKRERGYNQAALLARTLGRELDLPVEEHLLYRARRTVRQKGLTQQERSRNLRDAFRVREPVENGIRILLVDDIYTTGSTVDAAAFALRRAGAERVFVLTVAIGG